MKKFIIYSVASLSLFATSCKDDIPGGVVPEEGEDVVFSLNLEDNTRTIYGPENAAGTAQSIFWGSYISGKEDNIRIFSPQCVTGRNVADYKVIPQESNSSTASRIEKTGPYGLQWGTDTQGYQFFAAYPAEAVDKAMNGDMLNVTIENGQSPLAYGSSWDAVDNTLVSKPNENTNGDPVTIYASPDMGNAIMYAYTENVAKSNEPVPLKFKVLADVLEITINGPKYDNVLVNGSSRADFITIKNVQVKSTGDRIGGKFGLNVKTGETEKPQVGVHTLSMILPEKGGNQPRLYYRGNGKFDSLKVRFFLVPGANPEELEITINTDKGEYVQNGLKGEFAKGQIHKVSLKHFHYPGTTFKYDSWMSQLDENIFVNELSIPGAWHAANTNYQASTNFVEMFNAGVRAFEFHVGHDGYNAAIVEGSKTPLVAVFSSLGELLKQHNGEFVVIELGDPGTPNFAEIVQNALNKSKAYIYTDEITPSTTINDVKGKIIIKINTNGENNEKGWSLRTPALFSRWEPGNASSASTEALKWGNPIAPEGVSTLKWCFTEADNIDNLGGIAARKEAIRDLVSESYNNYIKGDHATWYECGIGGYLNKNVGTYNCQAVAQELNPYVLGLLRDSNRKACPLGLVLMNYATGTRGNQNAFSSQDLIQTIIYNNNAFILNRVPAENN